MQVRGSKVIRDSAKRALEWLLDALTSTQALKAERAYVKLLEWRVAGTPGDPVEQARICAELQRRRAILDRHIARRAPKA